MTESVLIVLLCSLVDLFDFGLEQRFKLLHIYHLSFVALFCLLCRVIILQEKEESKCFLQNFSYFLVRDLSL